MPGTITPPLYICIPFGALLLCIAMMPLIIPHFWEKNRNKAIITVIIGFPVLIYLLLENRHELIAAAHDYISFILLLAALFVISGGIRITGDIQATPVIISTILFVGAVLANFIGTTGASMVLIRPLLQIISERKRIGHIPVFFIFIVSNIGGCLTPLGDPPLFLGYLRGVPFTWTLKLFPMWITAVGILLATFYFWDTLCYKNEDVTSRLSDEKNIVPFSFSGLINLAFLAVVVLTVLCQIGGPYREVILVLMIVLSLAFTPKEFRKANRFTFGPISEVAILFAGIFITMVPLLKLLEIKGASLGIIHPRQYFWFAGGLSSFLDNAPTYLTFTSLAEGVTRSLGSMGIPIVQGIKVREDLLLAISAGSVFMGANTYIGNGPNFMVKAIAEEQKVRVPHFFGYMAYSGLILIPLFLILTVIYF